MSVDAVSADLALTDAPVFAPPAGFIRLRLTVAYHGAEFAGWQSQPHTRTVQDTLHEAFARLGASGAARPVAAGRTDAGVHADAMPAHIDVPDSFQLAPQRLARALNAHLPPDLAVLDAAHAPANFHARFGCTGRVYIYRLWTAPQRHPMWADRALHVLGQLDAEAMNAAAAALIGTHDFAAFATREDRHTVRKLRMLEVRRVGEIWEIHVQGESFLRHMVRGLVGTLLLAGQGHLTPAQTAEILKGGQRARAGANVPAHGLTFSGAEYGRMLYRSE